MSVKSQQRGKQRKRYFNAPSHERRIMMSAPLSKELQEKYNVKRLPIRLNDEVVVRTGSKKHSEGKVTKVRRARYMVYCDRITKEGRNGESEPVGLSASNLIITKLFINENRKKILARRCRTGLVLHRDTCRPDLAKKENTIMAD